MGGVKGAQVHKRCCAGWEGCARMHHRLEMSVGLQQSAQEVLHELERTQRLALVGEGAEMAWVGRVPRGAMQVVDGYGVKSLGKGSVGCQCNLGMVYLSAREVLHWLVKCGGWCRSEKEHESGQPGRKWPKIPQIPFLWE